MSDNTTRGGTSLAAILFIVFLILKLTHVIDWSWWWVTAPLWIPAAGAFVFGVVATLGYAIYRTLHRQRKD